MSAEQKLRYWANHPAGQAEPMRTDMLNAADEIERLDADAANERAEKESWKAVAHDHSERLKVMATQLDCDRQDTRPVPIETPADLGGCSIMCSGCGKTTVLRFTDSTKTRVSIESVTGWAYSSEEGVRCPSCAVDVKAPPVCDTKCFDWPRCECGRRCP